MRSSKRTSGLWLLAGLLALVGARSASALHVASGGAARVALVVPADATLAEETACRELADYLSRVTGAEFGSGEEDVTPAIHVGPTEAALEAGIDASQLGPEEWIARTVGDRLFVVGGRPRGTLYAVYHLLEDVVGVHWWTPWDETVPQEPELELPDLDLRGEPRFAYRDIYMLYGRDGGRFAARNRLNREGDATIAPQYGGCMDYGPPYHVHTFYMYIPPDEFFAEHPEWFSLIDGQRTADRAQLCLTDPGLRRVFLEKLRSYIAQSRVETEARGVPAPRVFSVSQNDWAGACQCEACAAIADAEGSEIGPLLDFVNFLADGIREEYPEALLSTLAYMYTDQPPASLRPRDNVIIRLCDTGSNFTKPITAEANTPFRERLAAWSGLADKLRIWDYAVTYAEPNVMPMPTAHTFPADLQFYAEHSVEGVFTELEYPVRADMRDLKVWLLIKLLEDPYADYGELLTTFTDGFYGPAGPAIREYLAALKTASDAKPGHISMGASPRQMRYLDIGFLRAAHGLFDEAEEAVEGDEALLRRVRHARMSLDRVTAILTPRLTRQWIAQGGNQEDYPLDRDAIIDGYLATWLEQIELRLPEGQREAERERARAEAAAQRAKPAFVALPERFRDLPPGDVIDFTADTSRNWQGTVKVVPDDEAESGITNRLVLSDEEMEKYALPMPWGVYDVANRQAVASASIGAEDVPGQGYHWYSMGEVEVQPSYYVYFFWSWIIQIDIDEAAGQSWEVWARIKFEGPGFPHGDAGEGNAICVERLVLVRNGQG